MDFSSSLSVLVVDDEPHARRRLVRLLDARGEVDEIDCAGSGQDAIEALRITAYDLMFLDVQMPEKTGLDVIKTIGPANVPPTIFVTAYDKYTLEAFELAALDYLLKPFDDDRFEQAFTRGLRVCTLHEAETVARRFASLLDGSPSEDAVSPETASSSPQSSSSSGPGAPGASSPYLERLTIDLPGKVQVIPVDQIRYITAEDTCVKVHTADEAYLLRERMHVLEKRLDPSDFARIHRSTIVRLDLIDVVLQRPGGDYAVRLSTGKELSVGRSRHQALLDRITGQAADTSH
jgi:two-component system LytT family response regulator